jgi:hypothetical protein
MSDYSIYRISSYITANIDCKIESVGSNNFTIIEEQSPSPSFPINLYDIVKVTVLQNGVQKNLYSVFEDQNYDGLDFRLTCGFDSNVYGNLIEVDTDVIKLEYYPLPSTSILDLKNYSLSPNIQLATYGKQFTPYHAVESYNIVAPEERVEFGANFRSLYSFDEKVLVDSCRNVAYKVSPSELSVVATNGKIKTALNFNVLIK